VNIATDHGCGYGKKPFTPRVPKIWATSLITVNIATCHSDDIRSSTVERY
jgi:hypothetical protein